MQTNPDVREMPRLLDEAIEDLPEELRQPIVAHFLYGRSHGAIARDMASRAGPSATASSAVSRSWVRSSERAGSPPPRPPSPRH